MVLDSGTVAAALEQANEAFYQTIVNNVHPKAKNLPGLFGQIERHLERYKVGCARTWLAYGLGKRFQRWFDAADEAEKPELALYLTAKAARDVLRHRETDQFAIEAARRGLDEWAEEQLDLMAAEHESSPELSPEQRTRTPAEVKKEPMENSESLLSRPDGAEGANSESPSGIAASSTTQIEPEPQQRPAPRTNHPPQTPSYFPGRLPNPSGLLKRKRPRMVDEGCLATVEYRNACTQTNDDEKGETSIKPQDLNAKIEELVNAAISRCNPGPQDPLVASTINSRMALVHESVPSRMITELPASEVMHYPAEMPNAYGRTILPQRRPEPGYPGPDMWDRSHGRGMRGEPYGYPGPDPGSVMDMWAFGRVGYRR